MFYFSFSVIKLWYYIYLILICVLFIIMIILLTLILPRINYNRTNEPWINVLTGLIIDSILKTLLEPHSHDQFFLSILKKSYTHSFSNKLPVHVILDSIPLSKVLSSNLVNENVVRKRDITKDDHSDFPTKISYQQNW